MKFLLESGTYFKPGDPCIIQLLSIARDIYKSFDERHEVKGVLFDISNEFDEVGIVAFFSN